MKTTYFDLIDQTFEFPTKEFTLSDQHTLHFNGIDLMQLISKYETPFKFSYLPSISQQIAKARTWFHEAYQKHDYKGSYHYCYCTKSSHFKPILEKVLENNVHLETSSAFDIDIIDALEKSGKLDKGNFILCNGYKPNAYLKKIAGLINARYTNVLPIVDNYSELDALNQLVDSPFEVGIRIAAEEEPKFEFYTSRLGIGYKDIIPWYNSVIANNPKVKLRILHFFINTGIRDNAYYWSELQKCLKVYAALKKICPTLDSLDIGGGFPIQNSLNFDFDYAYMIDEIVGQVKATCEEHQIPEPHLFTEFGSFTVGESGGAVFSILNQKQQNDREKWNMIDSSFMTTLPDSWAINKRFILLAINRWNQEYERVLLGGLTCDSDDYYNSEQHINAIYLPRFKKEEPLYVGFFNTGAYQESVGGYGGLQHCLTPAPKHILIDYNKQGELEATLFAEEQKAETMLKILGYQP